MQKRFREKKMFWKYFFQHAGGDKEYGMGGNSQQCAQRDTTGRVRGVASPLFCSRRLSLCLCLFFFSLSLSLDCVLRNFRIFPTQPALFLVCVCVYVTTVTLPGTLRHPTTIGETLSLAACWIRFFWCHTSRSLFQPQSSFGRSYFLFWFWSSSIQHKVASITTEKFYLILISVFTIQCITTFNTNTMADRRKLQGLYWFSFLSYSF